MGKVIGGLKAAGKGFLGLLFPEGITCNCCGGEIPYKEGVYVCAPCSEKLPRAEGKRCKKCSAEISDLSDFCMRCQSFALEFDAARFAYRYEGEAKRLVLRFKDGGERHLASQLAAVMAEELRVSGWEFDALTYVPLTPRAERERGYNQAKLLAEGIALLTGTEIVHLLKKVKETGEQKSLSASERHGNLQGCFRAVSKKMCAGKSVLLIDDVMTTGATASVCAVVLKRAGAAKVCVLTVCSTVKTGAFF